MTIEPIPQQRTFGELGFDAFYRRNVAIVYGYVLRLCGGSVERAQDLTRDAWVAFVDQVHAGCADELDVQWLILVARNRWIDLWRRSRTFQGGLGLVWNPMRDSDNHDSVTREQVLAQLNELDDDHRIVLMLRYIDELSVDQIVAAISWTPTATYSLLASARDDLRSRRVGPFVGGTS